MNVKEIIGVLKHAKKITLYSGDNSVEFFKDDALSVEAFGKYVVDEVAAISSEGESGHYEISVLMRPVVDGGV